MSEPTERLELQDPRLFTFEARVRDARGGPESAELVLDRSAFYPEGGGQLADQGVLYAQDREIRVLDVQREGPVVVHRTDGLIAPGTAVAGKVDRARRLEHMALHTGQHMLSRAFLDVARAETTSARLGEAAATLDLDRPRIAERLLHEVEDLVNDVVDDDRPVRASYPTPEALEGLRLRRSPKVREGIRV
ncbi:MAG: alanine--tRNA ligase-related protein, partial [Myxococcota bacterium]